MHGQFQLTDDQLAIREVAQRFTAKLSGVPPWAYGFVRMLVSLATGVGHICTSRPRPTEPSFPLRLTLRGMPVLVV
jgi:hypothetical protein